MSYSTSTFREALRPTQVVPLLSRFPYLGLKLAPGSARGALVTPSHVPVPQVPFSALQT